MTDKFGSQVQTELAYLEKSSFKTVDLFSMSC